VSWFGTLFCHALFYHEEEKRSPKSSSKGAVLTPRLVFYIVLLRDAFMDLIKDTDKSTQIENLLSEGGTRTNPFSSNVFGNRLYQKAERISAAVYILTRHIQESDPARVEARRLALELLGSLVSIRGFMRAHDSEEVLSTKGIIRRLVSALKLLVVSGSVSITNADLVIKGLDETGALLSGAVQDPYADNTELVGRLTETDKGQITRSRRMSFMEKKKLKSNPKRTSKGQRSENILLILGSGGSFGIKDIHDRIPEYGEKMIQRELKDLVLKGRVVKNGSKRWSTYSLA
jgi:hypothetical protein